MKNRTGMARRQGFRRYFSDNVSSLLAQLTVCQLVLAVFCVLIQEACREDMEEWRPPMPHARAAPPSAPPPLASAVAQCFPVLTDDAEVLAIDRCARQGGYVSHGWVYVDCWRGLPYEEGSKLLWHYSVASAAAEQEEPVEPGRTFR